MALVKTPEKHEIQESEERPKYSVTPRYGAWLKDDKFILEVALPGVHKENVKIKALEDFLTIRAERDNIEYVLDLDLNFRIEPDKVNSSYKEGLLRLEFERYKPLEHAFTLLERKEDKAETEGKGEGEGDDEGKEKKEKRYYKVYPSVYRHIDYANRKVDVEVSIPGVSKEDITLKVLPTWFHLSALRPEDEVEYTLNEGFGVEIIPEKTTYDYNMGLLKIHAVIPDPYEAAKEIKF